MKATSRRAFLGFGLGTLAATGVASAIRLTDPPYLGVLDDLSLPAVPAGMADGLCEAYAINTKLFYASQVYQHTDAAIELLDELGVRTVRERITTGTSPGALSQRYAMPRLAERGIRWHATVGRLADWPCAAEETGAALRLLADYYAPLVDGDLSVLLHSLGGCNEIDGPVVDGQVDPEWAAHARLMQVQLWRQAKADPLFASVPVVGPSTRTDVTVERAEMLGDLSAVSDWGNAHLYNRGGSPSRLIDQQLAVLERCFPDAPRWFFTETGYNNAPKDDSGRTISEDAAATYAIRAIGDYYLRESIYGRFELLDDPNPIDYSSQESINATADRQAHFGLIAMTEDSVDTATPDTWRRKPEFTATKALLDLMSDRGPCFRPDPLEFWVDAADDDLQLAVVQKRGGRHYLLLWRDVEVATHYPDARAIPVQRSEVTVHLRPHRPVAVYSPRHSTAPVTVQPARGSISVDLYGDLLVLEIG